MVEGKHIKELFKLGLSKEKRGLSVSKEVGAAIKDGGYFQKR